MKLDDTVSVGDLLTSLSILIGMGTLAASWWRDRQLRRGEIADRIRAAAGQTLARLERWNEILQALFVESQPVFVEVSERLAKDLDTTSARDMLWRELSRVNLLLLREIREEEVETAFIEICTYRPELRASFNSVAARIKATQAGIVDEFLRDTELDVVSFSGVGADSYSSAQLGNRLRATASRLSAKCRQEIEEAGAPLRSLLIELASKPNRELLRTGRPAEGEIV